MEKIDEDWRIGLADRLKQHVNHLAQTIGERHFGRPGRLDLAADYIDGKWREAEYDPLFQKFTLTHPPLVSKWRTRHGFDKKALSFRNVIAKLKGASDENIIVGAHYDTASGTPGADDNASGIAVLIEVARFLKKKYLAGGAPLAGAAPLKKNVTFVAFTNEEPPFSRTSAMGSAHFVKSALQKDEKIDFMLCLEMVGFYIDQPRSQSYPPFLKYFYPDRGNFIAVVGNLRSRSYVKQVKQIFEQETRIAVESLSAPRWVRGVDFSDHMNFWARGIPAVMITDTAFYRNPHYHQPSDTLQTLDFEKMAEVATGIAAVITGLIMEWT